MNFKYSGKIQVMAQFYELKQPGGESSQIVVFPKRNICVCCNVADVPLIKLKNCSHTNFLRGYFLNQIKLTVAAVCHYCHGVLKKIEDFKKQVQQSLLQSKMPYASKGIIKLQKTKQKIISIDPNPLIYMENIQNIEILKRVVKKEPIITSIPQEGNTKIDIDLCDYITDRRPNLQKTYASIPNNDVTVQLKSKNNVVSTNIAGIRKHCTEFNSMNKELSGDIINVSKKALNARTADISINDTISENKRPNLNITSSRYNDVCEKSVGFKDNEGLNELKDDLENEVLAWHISAEDCPDLDCEVIEDVPDADCLPVREAEVTKPTPPDNTTRLLCYEVDHKIAVVLLTLEEVQLKRDAKARDDKYLKLRHKCELCMVGYNHEDTLKTHMKKHDKNIGEYVCVVCQCVYSNETALKTHMECHLKRYLCLVCNLKFKQNDMCIMHYNTMHGENGNSVEKLYECSNEDCDFTSTNYYAYIMHRRKKHGNKRECGECGKIFPSNSTLKHHIEYVHRKSYRTYKCNVCSKEYRTLTGLNIHSRSEHTDNAPAYCTICNRQFKNQFTLNAHLKNHRTHVADEQMRYICDDCGQKFAFKRFLRLHIEYEHLKIRHRCKECNQIFSYESGLKKHISRKHSNMPKKAPGEKKLCQYCGKGFKHATSLRSHIWSHTGERPLQCTRCPANFAHKAALYNHNRLVHKVPKLNKQAK